MEVICDLERISINQAERSIMLQSNFIHYTSCSKLGFVIKARASRNKDLVVDLLGVLVDPCFEILFSIRFVAVKHFLVCYETL